MERRNFLLSAAPAIGLSILASAGHAQNSLTGISGEQKVENQRVPSASEASVTKPNDSRMVDIPLSPETKIAVERRGQIVLIGINRPQMFNRIDPDTFYGLAKAYYDFDNDPTLRAAVLVGHGEHFSRGNDVDAFSALAKSGKAFTLGAGQLDPLGRAQKLSKPLVAVAHGDTWNMGHELHLNADIRVASADVPVPPDRKRVRPCPRRRTGPLAKGGRMGKCHALSAHRRSLGCGDGAPDGRRSGNCI
jgi:hypothetical protein